MLCECWAGGGLCLGVWMVGVWVWMAAWMAADVFFLLFFSVGRLRHRQSLDYNHIAKHSIAEQLRHTRFSNLFHCCVGGGIAPKRGSAGVSRGGKVDPSFLGFYHG